MLKINRVVVVISVLIVTQLEVWSQNNTNSPYTRFGYGELADRSFAAGRAMGGIGIGLRSSRQINPMNPASYTSMDSLTFIFEVGAHAQMSWFTDGTNKQNNWNGNLEYIAMQFPLHRRVAMSVGLLPYSHVGYKFGEAKTEEGVAYGEAFIGTGGLNEVYGGLSIDIWKKRLAIGANVGYLFGDINHEQNASFGTGSSADAIYRNKKIEVRDVKLDFGVQYTHPLSRTDRVTVGAVFSPANKLNTKSYNIQRVGTDTKADTLSNQRFDIPNSYGLGLTYVKENKWTFGADALYETWDKARFFDEKDNFENRLRLGLGAEYIPNFQNRSFFQRVRYRAGAHYSNSYVKVNMTENGVTKKYGHDEYGVSLGLGLPFRTGYGVDDNRSLLNISFEYVKVKPELRTMIDEQYFRITVNMTFNEFWFFKQKVD